MINMHILILHRSEQICLATSLILVQVAIQSGQQSMKVSACDATPIRPRFIRKLVIHQRIWGDLCSDKAIWMDMFTLSWISKLSLINQLCCISHGFKIQHGTLPLMPDLKKKHVPKSLGHFEATFIQIYRYSYRCFCCDFVAIVSGVTSPLLLVAVSPGYCCLSCPFCFTETWLMANPTGSTTETCTYNRTVRACMEMVQCHIPSRQLCVCLPRQFANALIPAD